MIPWKFGDFSSLMGRIEELANLTADQGFPQADAILQLAEKIRQKMGLPSQSIEGTCRLKNLIKVHGSLADTNEIIPRRPPDFRGIVYKIRSELQLDNRFRQKRIVIKRLNGQIEDDDFPDASQIPREYEGWLDWLTEHLDKNPILTAWGQHAIFLAMHPFPDGNGRTTRCLEYRVINSVEVTPSFKASSSLKAPTELIDHLYFDEYKEALLETRRTGFLDRFIDYRIGALNRLAKSSNFSLIEAQSLV